MTVPSVFNPGIHLKFWDWKGGIHFYYFWTSVSSEYIYIWVQVKESCLPVEMDIFRLFLLSALGLE